MKENERLKHDKKQSRRSINFMGRSAYATTISLSTLKGGQTSKNKESPMSTHSKFSKIQDITASPIISRDMPLTERVNPSFSKIKKIPIASKIPIAPKRGGKLYKSTISKISLQDIHN